MFIFLVKHIKHRGSAVMNDIEQMNVIYNSGINVDFFLATLIYISAIGRHVKGVGD